jgi:hypothetical protein
MNHPGWLPRRLHARWVAYRDQVVGGVSEAEIRRRKAAFGQLMELMDGNDPQAEIARLERENEHF